MKRLLIFCLVFFLFLVSCFVNASGAQAYDNGVYIVYMGAAASTDGWNDHAQLLASVLKRKENALLHSYRHGFSGFAARLSAEEALALSKLQGVVSVFPDPIIQLHTTRSWNFLKYQADLLIDSNSSSDSELLSQGSDIIIGIIDTGIWPESESFNDKDMGPIPKRWKGSCNMGNKNISFGCNRKIIGAKFYDTKDEWPSSEYQTPRDMNGHGTHVAATAGGRAVQGVSYYGLAGGTAIGGSPGSRIAVYRVCTPDKGCTGSNILAAFDDAIADGVDILSLSLGGEGGIKRDLIDDPIAIGAFHAVEHGITVVCSAGNDGPASGTVVNTAPWLLTVAGSTIDRNFESDVVLGGNIMIKGEGIHFSNLQKSPVYPLIYAKSAMLKGRIADENEARNCLMGYLNETLVKGKILLCDNDHDSLSKEGKRDEMEGIGAVGVIMIDDKSRAVASAYGSFPMTVISSKDGAKIHAYIKSTRNPVATILPTELVKNYKPAPAIAYFSGRGPSILTRNVIKPDITAPGVNILAAWIGNDTTQAPKGKNPPLFNVASGTSMSCPHVSGIAAIIKSQNPTWSPSAIKSAIMTTAIQTNNLKAPITTSSDSVATPYDFGAGEVFPAASLQPGLVYDTTTVDYLNFMCYLGYNITKIKMIAKAIPEGFACPTGSSVDLISTINYPSIAISSFSRKKSSKIIRTVTNVDRDIETIYSASVVAPKGLNVKVTPNELRFTKNGQKLSYQVIFSTALSSLKEDVFGSITWSNGKYKVRIPFVVSSKKSSSN